MRLLICTQKVDENDPILGFFLQWISEFASKFELVTVVCLGKGKFNLPSNVRVLSLGKETNESRIKYLLNFYRYIWIERKNYDSVFVHMNKEYVLLGWIIWQILRKNIFLWYNHIYGNFLTTLAVMVSKKVFYTSLSAFPAQFNKAIQMGAGIDTKMFEYNSEPRIPLSLLYIGRISPIKNLRVLLEAVSILNQKNIFVTLKIFGDPSNHDIEYYKKLKSDFSLLIKNGAATFNKAIPHHKTAKFYSSHKIFLNATNRGSLDKTVLEAMCCGALPVLSNVSFKSIFPPEMNVLFFKENDADSAAQIIENILNIKEPEEIQFRKKLSDIVRDKHDVKKLVAEIRDIVDTSHQT